MLPVEFTIGIPGRPHVPSATLRSILESWWRRLCNARHNKHCAMPADIVVQYGVATPSVRKSYTSLCGVSLSPVTRRQQRDAASLC
jgi:hypothetical protein